MTTVGKSTMVKALTGNLELDSGELFFEGKPVTITNPEQASAMGMEVVYQDLALAPHLNPVQNMFLGREILERAFSARWASWTKRPCGQKRRRASRNSEVRSGHARLR